MNKPDTKMRACRGGCGQRYWCEKAGDCPDCRARSAAVAALRLHAKRPPECAAYVASQEQRIAELAERAAAGRPLFAA